MDFLGFKLVEMPNQGVCRVVLACFHMFSARYAAVEGLSRRISRISATLGCQVRMISRKTVQEQRLVGDHRPPTPTFRLRIAVREL